MDTSDPEIIFDENGVCNHCHKMERLLKIFPLDETAKVKLNSIIEDIKRSGKNNKYDCLIGVSGGVDSTYMAYMVKELGLKPLAVHFDNGWNSELAVSNIKNTLKKLNIDLVTYVMDWEEFKDLQLSFLKASVSDAEVPTDFGIFATLFNTAKQHNIRYILGGSNLRTEGIMPSSWTYGVTDQKYVRSVHKIFGKVPLKAYPQLSMSRWLYYLKVKKISNVLLLNYMPYDKKEAMKIIEEKLEWRNYGGKHYESIYTRFFQSYILPRKFNIDKRKAHLSTLINSGQITREAALKEMNEDIYSKEKMNDDKDYVIKKFGFTEKEFEDIMNLPIKNHRDYPSYFPFIQSMKGIINIAKKYKLWPEVH